MAKYWLLHNCWPLVQATGCIFWLQAPLPEKLLEHCRRLFLHDTSLHLQGRVLGSAVSSITKDDCRAHLDICVERMGPRGICHGALCGTCPAVLQHVHPAAISTCMGRAHTHWLHRPGQSFVLQPHMPGEVSAQASHSVYRCSSLPSRAAEGIETRHARSAMSVMGPVMQPVRLSRLTQQGVPGCTPCPNGATNRGHDCMHWP